VSAASSDPQKNHTLSIASLSAAFLVDSSEEQALPLLWPYMFSALGATVGQLGIILGVSRWVSTIFYPLWGYASDRFSRKKILVWFTGFWGLWTLGIAFVGNYPQLLTLRVISGLGLGAFAPAAFSLIGDLFDNRSRGRATGIMRSIGMLGIFISVILLPTLTQNNPNGWRISFALLGLASFLTGLFMMTLKEPTRGASEPELRNVITKETAERFSFKWADFWSLFKIPSWRYLLLNETLTKTSLAVFTGWNFTFLTGMNLKSPFFYVVIFVVFTGLVSGNIFFGWLGDRLDERISSRGRVTMMQIGLFISPPLLFGYIHANGENIPSLLLFSFLGGASYTATSEGVIWPIAHAVLPPELRGSNRAVISMVAGAVSASALIYSGSVVDKQGITNALIWFVPGLFLLSAFAWIPMLKSYTRDRDALHQLLLQRKDDLLGTKTSH